MQLVILSLSFDYTSHTKRPPLPAYAGTGYEMRGQAAGAYLVRDRQDRFGVLYMKKGISNIEQGTQNYEVQENRQRIGGASPTLHLNKSL